MDYLVFWNIIHVRSIGGNTAIRLAADPCLPIISGRPCQHSIIEVATQRPRIIDAIRSLGLKVTAADVSTKTGLPLNEVIRELNRIASDTSAVLQVSNVGTIAYIFPSDPDAVYRAKGLKQVVQKTLSVARDIFSFVLRCSFGVLLLWSVLTLLIIFAIALAFAMFATDAVDGDIGDADLDCAEGLNFTFFDVVNLGMFFVWWRNDVQGDITYYGRKVETRQTGFISNCFSFLFGDGDPNRTFLDEAWKNVADIIRLNNGVITAEQIGPYLVDFGTDGGIFPVLVRFDGMPEVTQTGNIVYVFPSMQNTAAGNSPIGNIFWTIPAFAEQKQWKFSEVPMRRLDFVFYFAGANLAGWYAVAGNMGRFDFLVPYTWIVELLLTYAIFFIAFPMVRSLYNAVRNAVVEVNNNRRKRNSELLTKPQTLAKMHEAQAYATALQWHNTRGVVYSTDKDVIEQPIQNEAEWLQMQAASTSQSAAVDRSV